MERKHAPLVCDAVVGCVEVVDELDDGQGLVPGLAEIEARKVDDAICARKFIKCDIRQLVCGFTSCRCRDQKIAVMRRKAQR